MAEVVQDVTSWSVAVMVIGAQVSQQVRVVIGGFIKRTGVSEGHWQTSVYSTIYTVSVF